MFILAWYLFLCPYIFYILLTGIWGSFYNHSRHYEHQQFLSWLLTQIQEKQPHALLIAGDIFDVINPGSQAQNNSTNF